MAGARLYIRKLIRILEAVDTLLEVIMDCFRNKDELEDSGSGSGSGDDDSRVTVRMPTNISSNLYQFEIAFSTLSSSMDSGNYTCSISIDSDDSLLYVEDSIPVSVTTTLSVEGMDVYMHISYLYVHVLYVHEYFRFVCKKDNF